MNRWLTKLKELTRSTFALTSGERKAVGLVLALALLGLSVKCWHAHQERQTSSVIGR
ncbi:MAG: hypothetical protein WCI95_01575 [bacterium]